MDKSDRSRFITRLDVLPHLVHRHQRLISSQPIYWWSPDWSLLPLCFAERHLWHNHPSYLDILCQLKVTNGRILFLKYTVRWGDCSLIKQTFEASIRIGPYYKCRWVSLSISVFQCLLFLLHQFQSNLAVKTATGQKITCIYYIWTHHWGWANDPADLFGVTKAGQETNTQPPPPFI